MPSARKRSLSDAAAADENEIIIQLLCTNDTHSQMEPFVAEQGSEKGTRIGGIVGRAALFESLRAECPATLTLDAGDLLVGTPYFTFLQGEADLVALRELRYDAIAVGNHDFDAVDEAHDGPPSSDSFGLGYFRRMATRHAPDVSVLCANVRDSTSGERLFAPHAVFEGAGVRVGVAAVLGAQAWEVTGVSGKVGLSLEDYVRAARDAALALDEQRCDVRVLLSHTGADRGDRELAALGEYDIVFSGHAHYFDACDSLEQLGGSPGQRLGLLSPGFARGGGVSCVQLAVHPSSRRLRVHSSGIRAVRPAEDGGGGAPASAVAAPERTTPESDGHQNGTAAHSAPHKHADGGVRAIGALVSEWSALFEARCAEVLGRAAEDLPLPPNDDLSQTVSAIHAALGRATLHEMRCRLPERLARPRSGADGASGGADGARCGALVVTNRYSAACGLGAGEELTLGWLLRLRAYDCPLLTVEMSAPLLLALLRRNARFAGRADFLYFDGDDGGVRYRLLTADGAPLPADGLSKEAIDAGALEVDEASVCVLGAPLRADGWYTAVVSDYVLYTTLADVAEMATGLRNEQRIDGAGEREVLRAFLRRGGELRAGESAR